jgi:hypothetical protein
VKVTQECDVREAIEILEPFLELGIDFYGGLDALGS